MALRSLAFAFALGLTTLAAGARADSESAKKLFDDALARMKDGNFADACPLLEQSLAQHSDMTTEFRLAECLEQVGRLVGALRHYEAVATAAAAAGKADREAYARQQAEALRLRVPHITIAAVDVDGLSIELDGVVMSTRGEPIEVEVGEHLIRATAPGHTPWSHSVKAVEGQRLRVDVPALTPVAVVPEPPPPDDDDNPLLEPLAIAGMGTAGLGLAVMGVGVALGFVAKGTYDDSLAECVDERYCSQRGLDMQDEAISQGTGGTVLFVVGAALLAGGAAMFIVSLVDDGPEVGVGPGAVTLRARF